MRPLNVIVILGVVGLLIAGIASSLSEEARRSEIRGRCTPIRHKAGETVIGYSARGDVVIGGTSDQTCYRCPDGFEECF